jgi:hypothetical protein
VAIDDPSIPGEAIVWRRINRVHLVTVERRLSSAAFSDSSDGTPMSATLATATSDPAAYAARWNAFGVVGISVQRLRELGLGVTRAPTDEDPDHVSIHGEKKKSVKTALARDARWVVEPAKDM